MSCSYSPVTFSTICLTCGESSTRAPSNRTVARKKPSSVATEMARARSTPSTSTLMFPSGSFTLCTMFASVPTAYISSGLGSSTEASCCVDRKIFLSPARASSRARTLASRPTINGVICCGKITMSRTGIMGTRFISCFSRVNIRAPEIQFRGHPKRPQPERTGSASLFQQTPVDLASAHHVRADHKVADLTLHGQVIHQFQHEVFENHTQAARADLALKRQLGDGLEGVVGKAEADVFEFEEALVLLEERVFRLGKNAHQRVFVEVVHDASDGQAPDKFGDQAVTNEIAGLYLLEQFGVALLRRGGSSIGVETERAAAGALLDNFFQADKGAAADKQNVGGIDRSKFLVRMLTAALGRHVGDGAFQNLEQRLLHAFAGDIAGDGGVLVFLGDFVDLVDIDDALLGLLNVAIRRLQQLQDNVFDVFADVAGFGEGGGVDNGEGHIEHAREGLREERLARSSRPNQQNIGFAEFAIAGLLVKEDSFVVVVDGNGEFLLGAVLADDVAIEKLLDLRGAGKAAGGGRGLLALFILENGLTDTDTFVADVGAGIVGRRTNQLLDLLLGLVAEGAAQWLVWIKFFHRCEGPWLRRAAGGVTIGILG